MEARWYATLWPKDGHTYLGGTNAFDLWFDDHSDVRVVWGQTLIKWDWFYWSRARKLYEWGSDDCAVEHRIVLGDALAYLRLFAPWVEEAMTKGELDYHAN
jgi:hypothetical protein